jgi:hypothetical protein
MDRVARWDGLLPDKLNTAGQREEYTPDDLRAMAAYLAERRPDGAAPIDIIVEGETPGDDPLAARGIVQPLRAAGATWWLESRWGDGRDEEAWRRIRQGPPSDDR